MSEITEPAQTTPDDEEGSTAQIDEDVAIQFADEVDEPITLDSDPDVLTAQEDAALVRLAQAAAVAGEVAPQPKKEPSVKAPKRERRPRLTMDEAKAELMRLTGIECKGKSEVYVFHRLRLARQGKVLPARTDSSRYKSDDELRKEITALQNGIPPKLGVNRRYLVMRLRVLKGCSNVTRRRVPGGGPALPKRGTQMILHVPEGMLEELKAVAVKHGYANRSSFIREAIAAALDRYGEADHAKTLRL